MRRILLLFFIFPGHFASILKVIKIPFLENQKEWKNCTEMPCIDGFVCKEISKEGYFGPLCIKLKSENKEHCDKNEHWDSCGGCENTCDRPETICTAVCIPSKASCRCNTQLVRNREGKCIELSSCPNPIQSNNSNYFESCKKLNCKYGQKCLLQGDRLRCGMNTNVQCNCSAGQLCILKIIQCFTTPCDALPLCIADPTTTPPCVLPCPLGETCKIGPNGPSCVPPPLTCGMNEVENQCGNRCEGKCQYAFGHPPPCPLICGPRACACKSGYYRDPRTKRCVTKWQCRQYQQSSSASSSSEENEQNYGGSDNQENPCAFATCLASSNCIVENGVAKCVPVTTP